MLQIILAVHCVLALAIIGLIMLQQGKGADMGASFGAGSSQTVFGSAGGGNVLARGTSWLAAAFFGTSIALAVVAKDQAASVGAVDVPAVEEVMEQTTDFDAPAADEPASDVPDFDAPPAGAGSDDGQVPEL